MKKIVILLSLVVSIFIVNSSNSFVGLVFAQNEVISADQEIGDPGMLPTNPFYFFKEFGRNIQRVFTFDPVARVELEVKITNQKAAEAKKIQEIIPNDNSAITKGLENFVAAQDKLKYSLEFLKTASSTPEIERVFSSMASDIAFHKKVLEQINTKAGDNETVKEALKAATNQINDAAATAVLMIGDIKQKAGPAAISNLENAAKTIISTVNPKTATVASPSFNKTETIESIPLVPVIKEADDGVFCTLEYDPVCAQPPMPTCSEGSMCAQVMPGLKTFSNECMAKISKAIIKYKGECVDLRTSATSTKSSINCLRYDPVCGIDGKTYSCGEADAQANEIKIAYIGECGNIASTTLMIATSTVAVKLDCGKENEKLNRDPLVGPVNKPCCEGLKEDRSNKFFSICLKPSAEEILNMSNTTDQIESVGIANPASVFCIKQGYKNEIKTNLDGSQYGVCIFKDGSECEEWKYFRGECGQNNIATSTNSVIKIESVISCPLLTPVSLEIQKQCALKGGRMETKQDEKGCDMTPICVSPTSLDANSSSL